MSPSWASPGLGTGKGHATPLPQGAPCRAGGADGPVSRRFRKKCDAGSSPGVRSGSGLPPAPPSGAQRWAGHARRTPEGSLGCSRDVNTVPCIPRVLFVQQPDHPPRPGSSCPLRTGQGRALQPPSLPGPSPNAYLYVCLSVSPTSVLQEAEAAHPREDGVEVLRAALQRRGAHALPPGDAPGCVRAGPPATGPEPAVRPGTPGPTTQAPLPLLLAPWDHFVVLRQVGVEHLPGLSRARGWARVRP